MMSDADLDAVYQKAWDLVLAEQQQGARPERHQEIARHVDAIEKATMDVKPAPDPPMSSVSPSFRTPMASRTEMTLLTACTRRRWD